ncbi:hypothetical protein ABEF95_016723 [Exophiala dermatitidis]
MFMWKREEKCHNTDPSLDLCEGYVSKWQTTGIPLIIGLSLFLLLSIVLFIIVRKRRKIQHAAEERKHREIDDEVELEYTMPNDQQAYKQQQQHQGDDLEYGLGIQQQPPPKYTH